MKVGADIFGMGGSVPAYNFIQPVMHERPVDQMTPRLQIIELILKAVDKYVQDTVYEIDKKPFKIGRDLAVIMGACEQKGKKSHFINLDIELIKQLILHDGEDTYQGGLKMINPDARKQMIIDAYNFLEHLENS